MSKKMDLRRERKSFLVINDLTDLDLKEKYYEEVERLKSKYPEAIHRTRLEIKFNALFVGNSRMLVIHSFWIGRYCVDLFIPALGLAIKVMAYVLKHIL